MLACFYKKIINSEGLTESRIGILFRLPFSVISQFSPVPSPHWMQKKSAKLYMSQEAFGTIFRTTGGFRNLLYSHRQLLYVSPSSEEGYRNDFWNK
jgi:hypothetical protein